MGQDLTAPVVIIGSGIAGLLTALKLAEKQIASMVITKTSLQESSSWMAQGGIAAVLPENTVDSLESHVQDTLKAGAGLSNETVVRSIVEEGAEAIQDLLNLGVPFDRENGKLAFTKEAAHSNHRILHAGGDATGRSIQDTLIQAIHNSPWVTVLSQHFVTGLKTHQKTCIGVTVIANEANSKAFSINTNNIIIATGGIGQLYAQTTNPTIATGDGIALAYEAGAKIQDIEFVQFHPTAFWADGSVKFLISEALRGEGGILRNKMGHAFAKDHHPAGELAPRDIVTRAIFAQMKADQAEHVYLDISHLPTQTIETRFPTILKGCSRFGIDIRTEWIPVAPAAHYGMGGIWVNAETGETTLPNIYAVGEVVSSGLHGANRLASNSLLECVVLARRVARHIANKPSQELHANSGIKETAEYSFAKENATCRQAIQQLRQTMWQEVGILRDAKGLNTALNTLKNIRAQAQENAWFTQVPQGIELKNMLLTAEVITLAALNRQESRGAHFRLDFPDVKEPAQHEVQQVLLPQAIL